MRAYLINDMRNPILRDQIRADNLGAIDIIHPVLNRHGDIPPRVRFVHVAVFEGGEVSHEAGDHVVG